MVDPHSPIPGQAQNLEHSFLMGTLGPWQVIMSHPVLDQAFENHARDYLCSESYDFIKEVGTLAVYFSSMRNRQALLAVVLGHKEC